MKKTFALIFSIFLIAQAGVASVPWHSIENGNAYWAKVLGVQAQKPQINSIKQNSSYQEVHPNPSIQLVNAALRYQIDNNLSSNELRRFADSLMHVIIYVSGASPMKADKFNRAGWWKLSYPVATRYGLTINNLIDERFNFDKSTRAAMLYAKDLQKQKGEKWMSAFIDDPLIAERQTRLKLKELKNDLSATYKLMVLSAYTNAEAYAVQHFYENVDFWKSNDQILADLIIEKSGISEADFYALNPELVTNVIPEKSSILLTGLALASVKKNKEDISLLSDARIEEGDEKLIAEKERIRQSIPDPSETKTTVYKVRSGDNLGYIAERFGVGVSQLKSWNNLRNDNIFAGQKLMIYSKVDRKPVTASAIAKQESRKVAAAEISQEDFLSYKVKSGDTLWSIAKKFPGVSPDNLMAWNHITPSINVGQEIKVKKSDIRDYNPNVYPDRL